MIINAKTANKIADCPSVRGPKEEGKIALTLIQTKIASAALGGMTQLSDLLISRDREVYNIVEAELLKAGYHLFDFGYNEKGFWLSIGWG